MKKLTTICVGVAVMAPMQFPKAVWDELVRQDKLKYSGQGLYELPER